MAAKVLIAPSILAADFTQLGAQVREVQAAGGDWVHIDVMDGRFVPNITMGPLIVSAVKRVTDLPLDVHLMIVEPERYIEAFAQAGASHITVHIEASPNLHRTLQMIREVGCKAGVALNPHTSARALGEIIHMIDIINVMTVNPGFGGQTFLKETMSKVTDLRAMIGGVQRPIDLEVDGGIDEQTAAASVQAGANVLIAGTAVFGNAKGIQSGITALRESLA